MKKIIVISFVFLLFSFGLKAQSDLGTQLWRNFNFGWDVYRTDDYRWRNLFIGTAYIQPFKPIPQAYLSVGANLNWGKYTIYPSGDFGLGRNNATLKITSFTIPTYIGYHVVKNKKFGVNFYTGPLIELIVASKLDGYSYDKINRFQTGWTIGSEYRFFYMFRARVAYSYYPIALLTNVNMARSAFTFSIGF